MPSADHSNTDPLPTAARGKHNELSPSRRGFLVGGGLTVAATGLALAVTIPALPAVAVTDRDARFWAARRKWRELEAAWELLDEDDPRRDAEQERVDDALVAMVGTPVLTATALLAKWQALGGQTLNLPGETRTSTRMIAWDLERIAKQELVS